MIATLTEKPIKIANDHYLLRINAPGARSCPGQFINIRANSGTSPLLRRPFSIFNHEGDMLEIIIQVIGKGTSLLSTAPAGDIDIIGPVGTGFTLCRDSNVMLVGGGVGNAPLYYLARKLRELNNSITFIFGARSSEYIYLKDKYEAVADRFIVTTDDGSAGIRCNAVNACMDITGDADWAGIYTCGPTPMMRLLSSIQGNIPVQVSLENYFGCGIGLCAGCTVETDNGLSRACVDGPVMDGRKINWETMAE